MNPLLITAIALVAFAANSVLCRLALGSELIDPAGFTAVRLISGALVLALLVFIQQQNTEVKAGDDVPLHAPRGSWLSSLYLFIYAVAFSFAYMLIDTATGALILFGSVQMTMIVSSIVSGNRLSMIEWAGVGMALCGFVYLVWPNLSTPTLMGFVLMVLSGIAWGFYSLAGRGSSNPLSDTAFNFIRSVPFAILLLLVSVSELHLSMRGFILACLSGAFASGLGYSIWYLALRYLRTTEAAVSQLLVPVIAAFGGVLFVSEPLSMSLLLSGLLVLGGILLVVLGKKSA